MSSKFSYFFYIAFSGKLDKVTLKFFSLRPHSHTSQSSSSVLGWEGEGNLGLLAINVSPFNSASRGCVNFSMCSAYASVKVCTETPVSVSGNFGRIMIFFFLFYYWELLNCTINMLYTSKTGDRSERGWKNGKLTAQPSKLATLYEYFMN